MVSSAARSAQVLREENALGCAWLGRKVALETLRGCRLQGLRVCTEINERRICGNVFNVGQRVCRGDLRRGVEVTVLPVRLV